MSRKAKILIGLIVLIAIIVGVVMYIKSKKESEKESKTEVVALEDGTEVVVDNTDPTKPVIVDTFQNEGLGAVNSEVGEDTTSTRK